MADDTVLNIPDLSAKWGRDCIFRDDAFQARSHGQGGPQGPTDTMAVQGTMLQKLCSGGLAGIIRTRS